MKKLLLISIILIFFTQSAFALPKECTPYLKEYRQTINTFKDRNLYGKTIFSGSSSIRMWKDTHTYFKTLSKNNYHNRGFGGSQVCHLLINYKSLFLGKNKKQHPSKLVIYSGDNDLSAGLAPNKIVEHYKLLIRYLRDSSVKAPIYFITVKPSPSRIHLKEKINTLSKMMESELSNAKDLFVINVFNDFFDEHGNIIEEYFLSDRLHLKPIVYKMWAKKLEALWK